MFNRLSIYRHIFINIIYINIMPTSHILPIIFTFQTLQSLIDNFCSVNAFIITQWYFPGQCCYQHIRFGNQRFVIKLGYVFQGEANIGIVSIKCSDIVGCGFDLGRIERNCNHIFITCILDNPIIPCIFHCLLQFTMIHVRCVNLRRICKLRF